MKVCAQWTDISAPSDWVELDSSDWASVSQGRIVHGLCVQGAVWDGYDHYAVEHVASDRIRVYAWNDDPGDWPEGQRWARVADIPNLAPDPKLGNAINVDHRHVVYADVDVLAMFQAAYDGNPYVTVRPWVDFAPPAASLTRDGQWVTDAQHARHQQVRTVRGWREWTDGVDPSLLDSDGNVAQQRPLGRWIKPIGTRTYYHNSTARATGVHVANEENAFETTAIGAVSESDSVGTAGQDSFVATTPAGEPDSASWPTGTYRYQIDVTAAGVDLNWGLLTLGSGVGHFGRVDAGLTTDLETHVQAEAAFSLPGLNMATYTGSWTAGASTDRFEIVLAAQRVAGHGSQTLTLQLGEIDDFADGPWPAAGVVQNNAILFGSNF